MIGIVFWQWVLAQEKSQRRVKNTKPAAAKPASVVSSAWQAVGIDRIDKMSGVEFENYIAGMVRSLGLRVTTTSVTGDYGVDLIISGQFAVQCKRQSRPVGTAAVQQVVAGAAMHGCSDMTFVISNQNFTQAAAKLAAASSCGLYGRDNFDHFMDVMREVAKFGSDDANRPHVRVEKVVKRTSVKPPLDPAKRTPKKTAKPKTVSGP
ncbi:MAG: restriction endonuclease [Akkermansiaceae bacterium]|nr:restriction endonuclease [Akkermansiaceae bacterium]